MGVGITASVPPFHRSTAGRELVHREHFAPDYVLHLYACAGFSSLENTFPSQWHCLERFAKLQMMWLYIAPRCSCNHSRGELLGWFLKAQS